MIPSKIIVDKTVVDENGLPYKGVQVFEKHLMVHPEFVDIALQGLKAAFGDVFTIEEVGDGDHDSIKKG